MKNWLNDAAGRAIVHGEHGAPTGVAISIESDGDDNESTTAEHHCLLPAPMTLPLSTVTSGQQQMQISSGGSTSTSINMEHINQPTTRRNSSIGARAGNNNSILASFLARQRSFTPVNSTPVRGSTTQHMNRRLQQSRSVGAPGNSLEQEQQPATAPATAAAVRQLGFWRLNLNEMFSLSTAPSTEALRSFIVHSNFRNSPATGGGAEIGSTAGESATTATAADNDPEASTSASISLRMNSNNSSGMGRSISLREDEMQPPRHSLNTRHTASVLGLSTPGLPSPPPYPAYETGHSDGASTAPSADATPSVANGNDPPNAHENNADNDHIIVDMVVQILGHFVRYLPIICILLIKFVHDHLLGILDLLLLQTLMYNLNRSLRFQVARLAQKNYPVLIRDACLVVIVVTVRLYMASTPPDPLGLLVPPPRAYQTVELPTSSSSHLALDENVPTTFQSSVETLKDAAADPVSVPKVIPLSLLLYYVAVSDLLLKLLTILIKIGITMLPMHVIRLKVRARLYVLVEYISQFYRALTPITQWCLFLYESYSGLEVISGGLLSSLYIGAKVFDLVERGKSLKKAIATFRRNIDSERPPTKDELDAAGTVCPICHDSYISPIVLECGHIFCDECVQTWFKREQTCPMCRAKVSDDPAWQDGSTTFFHQLY